MVDCLPWRRTLPKVRELGEAKDRMKMYPRQRFMRNNSIGFAAVTRARLALLLTNINHVISRCSEGLSEGHHESAKNSRCRSDI
jgi:hypothetical protein